MPQRPPTAEAVLTLAHTPPRWDALIADLQRRQFIRRIHEGIRQAEAGETMTTAEARRYRGRWLKPA